MKKNSSWTCPSRPRYDTCDVLSAGEKNPLGAAAAAGAPVSKVRSRCRHRLSPPTKKNSSWTCPSRPRYNTCNVLSAGEKNPLGAAAAAGAPGLEGRITMPPRVIAADEEEQFVDVPLPAQIQHLQRVIRRRKESARSGSRGGSPSLCGQVTMPPRVIAADEEEQFVDVPLPAQIQHLQRVIRRRKEPARSGSRGGSPSLCGQVTMPPRVIEEEQSRVVDRPRKLVGIELVTSEQEDLIRRQ